MQPLDNVHALQALTEMGVTVLAGALTTLGSSLFMFACQATSCELQAYKLTSYKWQATSHKSQG